MRNLLSLNIIILLVNILNKFKIVIVPIFYMVILLAPMALVQIFSINILIAINYLGRFM